MSVKNYSVDFDNEKLVYTFESIGTKQIIQKVVLFTPLPYNPEIYNLALCDVNENGLLNDTVVTNNDDTEQVLATVIFIINKFFETYPDKKVFFESPSKARIRLYQIAINRVYDKLSEKYLIEGVKSFKRQPFAKNINFEAFFISLKK